MATSMGEEEVESSRESLEFLDLWESVESSSSSLCAWECGGEALRWVESLASAVCKGVGQLVLEEDDSKVLEEDDSKVSREEVLEVAGVALEVADICGR